jgi:hypothetical protein
VIIRMWEWDVARDAHGGSVGLSGTRHGAMEALSRALLQAGRPTRGRIVPVTLRRPAHEPAYYMRGIPVRIAVFDGQVIQWR